MTIELNRRQIKIVSELNKSDGYLTSNYLAKVLGVSSRTIRNDLKELNELFLSQNMKIDSLTSKGYILNKVYKAKIKELIDFNQQYNKPISPEARTEFIKKQLLLNPKGISLNNIAKKLYVSESTISRDFLVVRKALKEKNISLKKKFLDTYYLYGDELKIRDVYFEYFKSIDVLKYSKNLDSMNLFEKKLKKISDRLAKALYLEDIKLPGYDFNYLVIKTAITLYRSEFGFRVGLLQIEESRFYQLIESILLKVVKDMHLETNDFNYISCTYHNVFTSNLTQFHNEKFQKDISFALESVSNTFNYQFSTNLTEKINQAYLTSSIIEKPVPDEVKLEYPLALEIAMSLCVLIEKSTGISYDDSALINIIYILASDLESDTLNRENKTRNTVIITDSGENVFELIKVKLKRYFPSINVLGFYPRYMAQKALTKNPDFLISTKPLNIVNIPFVIINPLLKDYDVLKITTLIRQLDYPNKISFNFQNLFREDLFARDIEINTQYDAIKYLYNMMANVDLADDEFLSDVLHREALSSTYVSNFAAMPHAISKTLGENVVSVLITKDPIDWNGDPVQVVFLINIKNVSEDNVKQIFKTFFDLISSSSTMQRIIKSKNFYEFIKNMNQ